MILDFLYDIKKSRILLWKDGDAIAFKALSGIPTEIKECIKKKKSLLLDILAYNEIDSEEKASSISYYKVPKSMRTNMLSVMQQGIYLQSKMDKKKYSYNVPVFIVLKNVKVDALNRSLLILLKQHPILRLCDITDQFTYRISSLDDFSISSLNVDEQDVSDMCKVKSEYAFDLNEGNLINIEIIFINNTNKVLLNLTHHHILSDGYSIGLILSDIFSVYNKIQNNDPILINENCYYDFVQFQNYNLHTKEYKKAIENLTRKLDSAEILPLKKSKTSRLDNESHSFEMEMAQEIYGKLQTISEKNQVSLYAVLFASLYHVLSNFIDGKTDFPIGLNISNRTYELNKVVGPCISTLPLVPQYNEKSSVITNIRKFHDDILYLHEFHHINLNLLAKGLTHKTRQELEDLMRVMFTMYNNQQSYYNFSQIHGTDIEFEPIQLKEKIEKFGISVDALEHDGRITFFVSYAKNLYELNYIRSIMESFTAFLENINEENLSQPICQIQLLNKKQYQKLISQFNTRDQKYTRNTTIHQLFEEQAKKTPEKIAIIFEDIKLSYHNLNEQSNRLARYLINNYTITPDTLIPLCLERNEHMIIAILAVLKAGAAYVPIDASYPIDRIQYVLKDVNAQFLLVNHFSAKIIPFIDDEIELIPIDSPQILKKLTLESARNPESKTTSKNLAYVIYTSGTTGYPKGVMIEHKGVVNLKYDLTKKYMLRENEVILQLSNYVFDASIEQFILALLNGYTLLLVKEKLWLNKEEFYHYLNENRVTHVEATPTLLEQYEFNKILNLRRIVSGGEYFSIECYRKIKIKNKQIINTYGPTETTINAVLNVIENDRIYIGKPVANTQCYILNKFLVPLPIGAIGELFIGGGGVARGYLNKPDLTSEKFIADPFSKNSRFYRTGDLVSWTDSGDIEYQGRNDTQIKVRGYRIELKEIEATLARYPGVRQSAACLKTQSNSGAPNLVGYYTSDSRLNEQDILEYLNDILPEYMVPKALVYLQNLPTTVNGKLNLAALPDPVIIFTENYIAPRNDLEIKICSIWAQILGLPKGSISIDMDFFRSGGNSILAIKAAHLINNEVFIDKLLSAKDIYVNSTINKLSNYLKINKPVIEEINLKDELNLDQTIIPIVPASNIKKSSKKNNIFVTGVTGFIGSYLLKELSKCNLVDKIFCLVVSDTEEGARFKIENTFSKYKLGDISSNVFPIPGTLEKSNFGFNQEQYRKLAKDVDIVIHNATFMNHLETYDALKQVNVRGTEEVLRFACTDRQKSINLVSTVNVFNNTTSNKKYDEATSIDEERHSYIDGYSSSKWVAEGLCNIARQRGINCNVYRLSLVLPDCKNPIYPNQQWFGRFIRACLDFGVIPIEFRQVETQFALVGEVAKAIMLCSTDLTNINKTFHLFSENTLSFARIFDRMKIVYNCKDIRLSGWLKKYQVEKVSNNFPVISIVEDEEAISDISSISERISSDMTNKHLIKYNINFKNCSDFYIDSLLSQAMMTNF